jgi:opacity protein-like surface antigen
MSRLKVFAIASLAAIAPLGAARAADMPMSLPPLVKAPVFVEQYQSGWYLRADIGYRWNEIDGISALVGAQPTGTTIDDRFVVGGGGGYKAGWFRADVTVDWGPRTGIAAVTPDYRVKLDTATVLANLYLDLGTWSGFTPYVGGGVGMSWNRTTDFVSNALLAPGVDGMKEARWEFAWAAIAGMSYHLSPNLLLDASYRYLNFGDALTPLATNNNQLTIKDLTAQEVRIGLRYNLN